MKRVLKSLKSELILSYGALIFIPLCIVSFLSYKNSSEIVLDHAIRNSESFLALTGERIDENYKQIAEIETMLDYSKVVKLAIRAANEKEKREYLSKSTDTDNIYSLISNFSIGKQEIDHIAVINRHGIAYNPKASFSIAEDFVESDLYKRTLEAKGAILIGSTVKNNFYHDSVSTPESIIPVTKAIMDPETLEYNGMVLVSVNQSYMNRYFNEKSIGDFIIFDRDGAVIFEKSSVPLSAEIKNKLSVAVKGGEKTNFTLRDAENEYLAILKPLDYTGWGIVNLISKNELFSDIKRMRNYILSITFLAIVIAAFAGILYSRRVTVPISRVVNMMNEVEKGNLAVKCEADSRKEFHRLANSFNDMVAKLKNLIGDIADASAVINESSNTIRNASRENMDAGRNISMTVDEIARASSHQAALAEEGAAVTGEFDKRISDVNRSVGDITKSVSTLRKLNEESRRSLDLLLAGADQTRDVAGEVVAEAGKLDESIKGIRNVVAVINNIMERTNLLALNAAIEAARAGESGKGFAVVADEIRKLADLSKKEINEISETLKGIGISVEGMMGKANKAGEIVQDQYEVIIKAGDGLLKTNEAGMTIIQAIEDVGKSICDIATGNKKVVELVQSISAASEETSACIEEVTGFMDTQNMAMERMYELTNVFAELTKKLEGRIGRFII